VKLNKPKNAWLDPGGRVAATKQSFERRRCDFQGLAKLIWIGSARLGLSRTGLVILR
jgi:hypothetical protein